MGDPETNISFISRPTSLQIVWKIPDYFSLPEDEEEYKLESPSFIFANSKWRVRFFPNRKEGADYSLHRYSSLVACHTLTSMFAITTNEEYSHVLRDKMIFERNEGKRNAGYLPTRSQWLEKRDELTVDGTLTLTWHLTSEGSKDSVISENVVHKLDANEILCRDFKNLLLNGTDCDLTLKVKDKEFRVHRLILRARSQVFESMLTHDMIEKNSGVVDIPDCDPQAMEQFLSYVYCGKVDALKEENMLGLYYTADKYEMMSLKEECCDFIQESLSCNNICDVVQLALNHKDKSLLEHASEFFVKNTSEILTTTEWITFLKENEIAANELFIKSSKKWTDTKQKIKTTKK